MGPTNIPIITDGLLNVKREESQMAENWTQFRMTDIPKPVLQTLASRARRQTVEKLQAPAELFDQAEALVAAGYVELTMRNVGYVYDPEPGRLGGGWLMVSRDYCPHCDDAALPGVCRHKIAVWFMDLLARHLPDAPEPAERPELAGGADAQPAGQAAGLGAATGGHIGHIHHTAASDGKHCPYCGGWLTSAGDCNKCGGAR
jgi:hypothetical protein